jgi:hypothetical protein
MLARAARQWVRRSGTLLGGGVSEWPKEHASKACEGASPPRVQIPSPPLVNRSNGGTALRGCPAVALLVPVHVLVSVHVARPFVVLPVTANSPSWRPADTHGPSTEIGSCRMINRCLPIEAPLPTSCRSDLPGTGLRLQQGPNPLRGDRHGRAREDTAPKVTGRTRRAGPLTDRPYVLPADAGGGYEIRTREGFIPTRFPSVRPRPLGESSVEKDTHTPRGLGTGYSSQRPSCGVHPVNSPRAGRQQG